MVTARLVLAIAAGIFLLARHAEAAAHRIEPDDYAEGEVLNDVHPLVQLRIYNGVLRPNFPDDFGVFPDPEVIPVTANENEDIFRGYFTSTGTKSFGHANITFFPESAQLAMRFLEPASEVSVDFIGTNLLDDAVGVLEVFNSQGALLDTFTSQPVTAHEIVTLSLTRPAGDIGYARAFASPDADPFGALDNLRFDTSASSLVGDFNGDGSVDAADYVVWRKGLGTDYTPNDYSIWRQNFGRTSAATTTMSVTIIPEPAAGILAIVAAMRCAVNRLRRTSFLAIFPVDSI